MDTLIIEQLRVLTHIGVYSWEQQIKQQLLIDISIPSDFSSCADDLNETIDYAALCTQITNFVESNSFQLIEFVANQVAELIKVEFNVQKVTVGITKPHAVVNAGIIKVTVTR